MKYIPTYPKILTLGSSRTHNALEGEVIIQEKIDGSQFRLGLNEDGEILVSSRRKHIPCYEQCQKMFRTGYEYVHSIAGVIKENFPRDTYFYGEYLQKPKHNTLSYERTPKNNIALFDVLKEGRWVSREELEAIAEILEVDVIPELWRGTITDTDKLKALTKETLSCLGKEITEGIVIKNYNQTIELGNNIFPLFTKVVREEFKERHGRNPLYNKSSKLKEFKNSFCNENRWEKAIQHLREEGKLSNTPKDIGILFKEVHEDIIEEETENIKNFLYNYYIKDIKKMATRGLAEWYKEKLFDNIKGDKGE